MIKRFFIYIIIAVLSIGNYTAVTADNEKNVEINQASKVLYLLNIIKGCGDGDLRLDENATRAELTVMIVRSLGYENDIKEFDIQDEKEFLFYKFRDILLEHWAARYILLANILGIVDGVGNHKFEPDTNVLYEDAVTMVVRMLGYRPRVRYEGGYPFGYLSIAKELGILKNVNGEVGSFLRRRDIAQLIFNCLTVNLVEQASAPPGEFRLVESNENILTDKLDVERNKGRVSDIRNGEVCINSIWYKDITYTAKNCLNCDVEFYYIKDKNGQKVLIVVKKQK